MSYKADLERTPSYDILEEGICGDQTTIEFRLGVLEAEAKRVLMSTSLLEMGKGIFDIRFGYRIQDIAHEWNVSPMDFAVTSKGIFIVREERATVRRLVCNAITRLAEFKRPALMTMSTYYSGLPQQALTKYAEIEARLTAAGWTTASSFRDETGIDRWTFLPRETRP